MSKSVNQKSDIVLIYVFNVLIFVYYSILTIKAKILNKINDT